MDLVYLLAFAGSMFACVGALLWALAEGGPERRIAKRLHRVLADRHHRPGPVAVAPRLKRDTRETRLDAIVQRLLPQAAALRRQLARTGLGITIGRFGLIVLAVACIVARAAIWAGLEPLVAWPAGLVTGLMLPRGLVAWFVRRRVNEFLTQLPEAINLMARGLRSGLPIAETVAASAREIQGPVGAEFRRIAEEAQLGQPLVDVLWRSAERVDLPEFAFMVVAFSIQQETGGNLAETLDNLTQVLLRRRQMQLKVRAFTAEARSSAWIIAALPVVVLALLSITNMHYVSQLFVTRAGNEMLVAAAACILLGVLSLTKLCRFER